MSGAIAVSQFKKFYSYFNLLSHHAPARVLGECKSLLLEKWSALPVVL